MFSIQENVGKNRLYITIGTLIIRDTNDVVNSMVKRSSKLQKGFTVLMDLTTFRPTSDIVTRQICLGLEFMAEQGMGKVALISLAMEAIMGLDILCKPGSAGVQTVSSVVEGEKVLDWWVAEQRAMDDSKRKRPQTILRKNRLTRGLFQSIGLR
ncbi:MAG: hypothetical protein JEZ02_07235 [Desulfatibacillum sp.]|nr:hypothetical protein [Desulfatibacillum sp.]